MDNIREGMLRGTSGGCKTFDQSLLDLHAAGLVNAEEALANADYPNDLRLHLKGADEDTESDSPEIGLVARESESPSTPEELSPAPEELSPASRLSNDEQVLLKMV